MSSGKDNRRSDRDRRERDHDHDHGHGHGRGGRDGGHGHSHGNEGGRGGHDHQKGRGRDDRAPQGSAGGARGEVKLPEANVPEQAGMVLAPVERQRDTSAMVYRYVVGSSPELESRVRDGALVVAQMGVLKWTSAATFGRNPGFLPKDVILTERGTALHGDVVAVELAPQSAWNVDPKQQDKGGDGEIVPKGDTQTPQTKPKGPTLRPQGMQENVDLGGGRVVFQGLQTPESSGRPKNAPPAMKISFDIGATAPKNWPAELQPIGKVVRVLERRFTRLHPCRFIDESNQKSGEEGKPFDPSFLQANRWYKFRPYDEHFPYIAVHGRDIPDELRANLDKSLLMVEIQVDAKGDPDWRGEGRYPIGAVVRSLGLEGTAEAESRAISSLCQIRDFPFPDEVEECIAKDFTIPSKEELDRMGRRDLRDQEFVMTIDPATARDLDDALSAEQLPGGRFRVGVHIADVSYFVPIGSPLDEEARARSTSTYLVERVVPMLPRKLSEHYCSINGGEEKFAFSCLWIIDDNGNIEPGSEWIGQSVIRNSCRMAYEQAQAILDGDESGEGLPIVEYGGMTRADILKKVVRSIKNLHKVSSRLRAARWERGALGLNRQKMKLKMVDMNSRLAPRGFSLESSIDANWVVEELMLLANCRVAEKICQFQPHNGMIRKHDAPQAKKLRAVQQAAKGFGYDINTGSSKTLAESLKKYEGSPDSDALRLMLTYCMSLAMYVSSGIDHAGEYIGHYALAVPLYTHFTSPIRRYCDLVVHRQLLLSLEIEKIVNQMKEKGISDPKIDPSSEELQYSKFFLSDEETALIAEHANECKTNARNAGTYSIKSFFCFYLRALEQRARLDGSVAWPITDNAICSKVTKNSFVLVSRQTAIEVEIFHNSRNQLWVEPNEVDPVKGKFTINWGPQQEGGEPQIEAGGLFFNCVVEFRVVQGARIDVDFVVRPPWDRKSVTGVPTSLAAEDA